MEQNSDKAMINEALFFHLTMMFQMAAMQQMGKIQNPITQKIERDLEQAKFSIDVLGMLQDKTKGNLSDKEEEVLKKALFELQMNYVDEVNRSQTEEKESETSSGEKSPGDDTDGEGKAGEAPDGTIEGKASGSGEKSKKSEAPKKKRSKPEKSE